MRFGVNYVPRRDWWYWWNDGDDASCAGDLDAIAQLGFDHVRIQCLWPVFQPNAGWVSDRAVERLIRLLDLAAERSLAVCVTCVDGWLSGFDFRPAWLGRTDPFTDLDALAACELLVTAIADAVRAHPALWTIDIANEPNVLMRHLPPGGGEDWAAALLRAARTAGVPVTVGVDHEPWMRDATPLRRDFVVSESDIVSIHAWPYFTGALERFGEERAWAVADYLAQVALTVTGAVDKPLWIQELGVAESWLTDADPADFAERMLRRSAAVPGVDAITWWASHDIDRRHRGFEELEYGLGLIDSDGAVKPIGHRISTVVAELRAEGSTTRIPRTRIELAPSTAPDLAFAATWFAHMEEEVGPRIELSGPR